MLSFSLSPQALRATANAVACAVLLALPGVAQDNSAQRLLLEAERQIQNGNLEEGLAEYTALVERYPQSPLAPSALLQSAWVLYGANLADEAKTTAQRLIDSYPDSGESASAYVIQGRIGRETAASPGDLDTARNAFNRVPLLYGAERFPSLPARTEARVRSADLSVLLGDFDEASASYLEALEDEPAGAYTANARIGFAHVLLSRGEWVAAVQLLQAVLSDTDGNELKRDVNAAAREHVTLAHRLFLRPAAGQPSWTSSRPLAVVGTELDKPRGLAAGPDGRLLVATATALLSIDSGGQATRLSQAKNAGRPWLLPDGRGFAPLGGILQETFSRRTTSLTLGGEKPKALDRPVAGARSAFDEWLVVDEKMPEAVVVFDRDTRYLGTYGVPGARLVDVVASRSGKIYALDEKSPRILRFAIDGELEQALPLALARPEAFDVDTLGNLYVLDSRNREVQILSPDGSTLTKLGPSLPGGLAPRSLEDIAVDGFGRIYLSSRRDSNILVIE
ncbi:MAG: tetratricopeptide repeat protein [Acidobacteriota bacterium]